MEQKVSGKSFRKFLSTSRGCPFFLEIWKFRKFPVPFDISTRYESAPVPLAVKNVKMAMSFSSRHESTAFQIYQALILPHFDYCSPVWDELSVTLSDKLQKLQNRAARPITRSSYDTSASILLNRLNWDNLSTRRKKLKATLMFKIIKGLSLAYLQDLFSIRSTP